MTGGPGGGQAVGSGFFVQGSVLTFGGTGTYTVANDIADQNGTFGSGASDGLGGTGGATSLHKIGVGTLVLAGSNSYSGATNVEAGLLQVDGSIASATKVAGGTLGGNGTTGEVTVAANGALAPGDGTGVLHTGILHTGNLTLVADANFFVELAGTAHDQAAVTGAVNLAGANLAVSLLSGFHPSVGDSFTILANDGSDEIGGTFAGLAQGATFLTGGDRFQISYTGGDGNDIVLTAIAATIDLVGTPVQDPPHLAGILF